MKRLSVALPLLLVLGVLHAQKSPSEIKFGKISVSDLQKTVYSVDSNANAVVIADIGKSLSSTVGSEAWNSRDLKSRPH